MTEARAPTSAWLLSASAILSPGAFRLALAFAVVVSHVSAVEIGRLAVLLFFFLSGYWTSRIWREKFDGQRIGRYYLSRYWRVAPLFVIVSVAAALARHWALHPVNFTLLGVGSTHFDPTGVSWSLDVELQFYLLLPLLFGMLSRSPRLVLLAALVAAVAGLWLSATYHIVTVATYLPAFLLGSLTYARAWKPSATQAHLSLLAFIAFTIATGFTPFLLKTRPNPFEGDIWGFFWMLPLLPYVAHSLTIRSSKLDRHLGNLSFPLYLVHYAVIAVVTGAFGRGLGVKAAAVALACALALTIYMALDRPIDRLRVRVTES